MNRTGLKLAGLTILLAHLCCFTMAQKDAKYSFGIFVDPQITWLKSDNTKRIAGDGSITTINIGFDADKYFAKRYAFTTGISLNSIGGQLKLKDSSEITTVNESYPLKANSKVKFRGQYVTIPIGLKFRSTQIGYISFYASVGLKANIRLRGYTWAEEKYSALTPPKEIDKEKSNDHFNVVFASYFMNLGIEYSLGGDSQSAVQLGLSYTGGLTSLLDTEKANSKVDASILGQAISLRLGFVF